MMPVMDGFQFREEQLRDSTIAGIPVIIMSADGHMEKKIQKTYVTGYVRKPFDLDEILQVVSRHSLAS
jgi:CheY-like chemotaxis protein